MQIGQKTFLSSLFTIAGQWSNRFLGIISIVILARILSPDDYGVVAIAQISISLAQILLADGSRAYLIRKQNVTADDYNTAWTVRFILVVIMALLLFFYRGFFADFFADKRLYEILYYLSFGVFITAFENIGQVINEKNLDYKKIFLHGFSVKIIAFIITVWGAVYLRNFWALVYGLVAMQISRTILSYYFFSYRPKFSLLKIREQWEFTKWMFLGNITSFIRNKLDKILISKYLGATDMGYFTMANHLADLPYTEVIEPINKVVFSSYSSVLSNKEKLSEMFIKVVGVILIISFPIYFGFLALSENIIFVVLGEKWAYINNIIPIIIFILAVQSVSLLATNLLTVLGKVKILAIINWLLVLIMLPVLFYVILFGDLVLFLWARLLLALAFIPIFYLVLFYHLKINKYLFFMAIIRPFIAAFSMFCVVFYTLDILGFYYSNLVVILLELIIGFVVYSVLLLLLWYIMGKKLGGEDYILDKFFFVFSKLSPDN